MISAGKAGLGPDFYGDVTSGTRSLKTPYLCAAAHSHQGKCNGLKLLSRLLCAENFPIEDT